MPKKPLSSGSGTAKQKRSMSKRPRKNPQNEPGALPSERYTIRITAWDYHYSFGLADPKTRFPGYPYKEFVALDFTGNVIEPEGFKYPRAELSLGPEAGLLDRRAQDAASSIGFLMARFELILGYLLVPAERYEELVRMAASDRIVEAHLIGTPLRHRKADIHHFSLATRIDESA